MHSGNTVVATAYPRHVTPEGCQFVVEGSGLPKGTRIRFTLEERAVLARVSWVVSDRAGIAFDSPLQPTQLFHLRRQGRVGHGVDVYSA